MYRTRVFSGALAALILGMAFDTAEAGTPAPEPIACGTFYTVARGDTLFVIAQRAYGDGWQYKALHAANSDLLPTAEALEIGYEILIPCRDGRGPATRAQALAAAAPVLPAAPGSMSDAEPGEDPGVVMHVPADAAVRRTAVVALPEIAMLPGDLADQAAARDRAATPLLLSAPSEAGPGDRRDGAPAIRILSAVGLAPAGGFQAGRMTSDLVRRAVALAAPEADVRIDVLAGDVTAPDALLPDGMHDVSFPWLMPDCNGGASLSRESQRLCNDYSFSRPLLEATVTYHVRAGDPLAGARDRTLLAGHTICQPEGHVPVEPMRPGGAGPTPVIAPAPSAADCFFRLLEGEVDMVVLLDDDAESVIAAQGIESAVAEATGLRDRRTIHVIARKGDILGEAALSAIDRGIERLMLSGAWFDLVASHRSRDRAVR